MNKWITFDCYGTLVDWQTGMQHSLEIIQPSHGRALTALHRRIEGDIEHIVALRKEHLKTESAHMLSEVENKIAGLKAWVFWNKTGSTPIL